MDSGVHPLIFYTSFYFKWSTLFLFQEFEGNTRELSCSSSWNLWHHPPSFFHYLFDLFSVISLDPVSITRGLTPQKDPKWRGRNHYASPIVFIKSDSPTMISASHDHWGHGHYHHGRRSYFCQLRGFLESLSLVLCDISLESSVPHSPKGGQGRHLTTWWMVLNTCTLCLLISWGITIYTLWYHQWK